METAVLRNARADDVTLVRRWREDRDHAAHAELVERYRPLAAWVARRYTQTTTEPYEDLLQVACLGLCNAIERFDPGRGMPLRAFAVPTMTGQIRRHFRDGAWAIHVPRGTKTRARAVRRAVEELERALGRSPTVAEVAARVGITSEQVIEAREAEHCFRTQPLEARADDSDPWEEHVASEETGYRAVENRLALERALTTLSDRQRRVVAMRFEDELTQVEIAARLGCSQMQVSRLLRSALERIRALASHSAPSEMWVS